MTSRILVCRTCPRYQPLPPPGQETAGKALGRLVTSAAAALPEGTDVAVRVVSCLAGCKNPCNLAIDAPGKYRLRFSHLSAADLPAILALVPKHAESADGRLSPEDLPAEIRARLTACSPPRIGDD